MGMGMGMGMGMVRARRRQLPLWVRCAVALLPSPVRSSSFVSLGILLAPRRGEETFFFNSGTRGRFHLYQAVLVGNYWE